MIFKNTNDINISNGVKILVYGPTGVGKTKLIETLPGPVLIVNTEYGLLSIKHSNLTYIDVNNYSEFLDFYNWCLSSKEFNNFQSIAIDGLTDIFEVCLKQLKIDHKHGQKAYYEIKDLSIEILRGFRKMNKTIYFTAKMEKQYDELTSMFHYGPSFPGKKLPLDIPHYLDEVFHMDIVKYEGKNIRVLRTEREINIEAKDRSGKLNSWENPDLTAIINKIMA